MVEGLRHGGFGGPAVKFTGIDGRFGVFVGGRGGWIINQTVAIGGGGYALANPSNFDHLTDGTGNPGRLEMAYGGLELGYSHRSQNTVHIALGLLIGAGGVAWEPDGSAGTRLDDSVFIAEPEFSLVVRATRVLEVRLGVSYRLTRGVELLDLGDSDLSGPTGVVTLQFGSS